MEKKQITEAPIKPESISNYIVRAFNNYIKPIELDPRDANVIKQKAKQIEQQYFATKKIDNKILGELASAAYVFLQSNVQPDKDAKAKASGASTGTTSTAATSAPSSTATTSAPTMQPLPYNQIVSSLAGLTLKQKQKLMQKLQQQLATPPKTP
jgi:hypothetical protein